MRRISYLYPGSLDNPADRTIFDAFRAEMHTPGYVEGENLLIDSRGAKGKAERLPGLVSELRAPDVFVAIATPTIAAAQRAASTVPIVMAPATGYRGISSASVRRALSDSSNSLKRDASSSAESASVK